MKIETDKKPTASTCIIVLGMHRSGTSALTGVLSLLGIQPGDKLVPAMEDVNPKGFWEHAEIVTIHEQLLAALDSSWNDESALPDQWWQFPLATSFRNRIVDVLRRDFSGQSIWLIKDPRICRLLPLWQQVLRELDCKPLYVISIRNPTEVARSLLKRDELPEETSCLLWLSHMLEAEHQTRGQQRVFVSYENLLSDWRGAIKNAEKALEITWPIPIDEATPSIESFLDPALRHHTKNDSPLAHPICQLAQEGYIRLSTEPSNFAQLDHLRSQTTDFIRLVTPWTKQLNHSKKNVYKLEVAANQFRATISSLQYENTSLHAEIMRVKNTFSWQITKPLRLIWNFPHHIFSRKYRK